MDIPYMRTKSGFTNDSTFVSEAFIRENAAISVPYLAFLCIFTMTGSIGNLMVIGSVAVHKVRPVCEREIFAF